MYEVTLVPVNLISETEEHDPSRVASLAKTIKRHNLWTVPVVLESKNLAIMDGHHRFNAAQMLKLVRIPCVLLGYDSANVRLRSWRHNWKPSIFDVMEKIKSKQKFPYKTTRHSFDPPLQEISVTLSLLY